jgi:peptidoglycan-associated lipoprotein
MQLRIKYSFALLLNIAAVSTGQAVAQDQAAGKADKPPRAELAVDYSYLHSNAPPGGCGCFNLNGGSATFAWRLKPASTAGLGSFALVGDVTVVNTGTISNSGDSLTVSTFTGGGRYLPRLGHLPLEPFGQALIGFAHSSGTLVQGQNPGAANAAAAFAANLGGGIDVHATPRFSLRLVEADYLLTAFDNGTNDHQNNIRISAGLVVHF